MDPKELIPKKMPPLPSNRHTYRQTFNFIYIEEDILMFDKECMSGESGSI
jgi:hypothetical protein